MNLNRRNYPPEHGIRLPLADLRDLLVRLFEAVDMAPEDAELLSGILSRNTERCLYSHGTGQVPYYLQKIKDGHVNPRPRITVVSESPGTLVMDGDGGLGYFPCYRGTEALIPKARACGIAALTTRNHQHFGSAGIYTRMAVEHDCIGWSMSSHRTYLKPDATIYNVVDSSPTSIAIPAGEQPPLVMDMGGYLIGYKEDLFERLPTTFFKALALSSAIRALGGVFAGAYRQEFIDSKWEANQGAFIVVVDVAHFMPVDELKREMDRFIADARKAAPLPGMERAELAGGNEWRWARDNQANGIPLSDEHCRALQAEADTLGLNTPFSRFEHTRF
jgi:LDH2 family malate/lactate/ureidoglycolate dehydrogenase